MLGTVTCCGQRPPGRGWAGRSGQPPCKLIQGRKIFAAGEGRGGHWEQERNPYLLIYYLTLFKTFKNHHQSRQNKHSLLT